MMLCISPTALSLGQWGRHDNKPVRRGRPRINVVFDPLEHIGVEEIWGCRISATARLRPH
jgi:hypothetical protein